VEHSVRNQHFRQIIHHLESRSSYRVRIAAHDAHHCEGQIVDIYFNRMSIFFLENRHPSLVVCNVL
jgi:hypothetical protein